MSISQNESGRAFEYGIAYALSEALPAKLLINETIKRAESSFIKHDSKEQVKMVKAAKEASQFLAAHDNRLGENVCTVMLESDQLGRLGKVKSFDG